MHRIRFEIILPSTPVRRDLAVFEQGTCILGTVFVVAVDESFGVRRGNAV